MKRIFALVLACMFSFIFCANAEIDLSSMSEEELISLIDSARLELTKFHPLAAEGSILYEDENIRVTYTGKMELDMFDSLNVNVIIENITDSNIIIGFNEASCNGWAIWEATASVPAGKKAKVDLSFMDAVNDAELNDVSDVKDISCTIRYFDEDTFETLCETEPQTWLFN